MLRLSIRDHAILYLLSSTLDVKPATRFELVSAAYETAALPIELRRHCSARCQLATLFHGYVSSQAGSVRYNK